MNITLVMQLTQSYNEGKSMGRYTICNIGKWYIYTHHIKGTSRWCCLYSMINSPTCHTSHARHSDGQIRTNELIGPPIAAPSFPYTQTSPLTPHPTQSHTIYPPLYTPIPFFYFYKYYSFNSVCAWCTMYACLHGYILYYIPTYTDVHIYIFIFY